MIKSGVRSNDLADEATKCDSPAEVTALVLADAALRWIEDLSTQGIFTTDRDLNIRSWNQWLEAHTGRLRSEMIGRNLLEAYPELSARGLDSYYRDVVNGQVRVLSNKLHGHLLSMPVPGN